VFKAQEFTDFGFLKKLLWSVGGSFSGIKLEHQDGKRGGI